MALKFLNDIETAEDVQFKNSSGTNAGKIAMDGDDLVLSNAVGDILFGDADSDVYIGDGVTSIDVIFEQSGSIRGETGGSATLTLGSVDTTLSIYAPKITNLSTQSSEATALMINGSNVIGTRELGSAAFSATSAFATSAQGTTADAALPKAGGTMTGDINLSTGAASIKKTANTSGNYPAVEVYSSGTGDSGSAIAIQQATSEGDTIIFADYEPHVEWGISAENNSNEIHFTGGGSSPSLGSKTFKNNAGADRTAYKKMTISLSSGNVAIGGALSVTGSISGSNFSGSSSGTNTGDQVLPTLASLGAASSSHSHSIHALTARRSGVNIDTVGNDNFWETTISTQTDLGTKPTSYVHVVSFGDETAGVQFGSPYSSSTKLYYRQGTDNGSSENGANTYKNWRELLTTSGGTMIGDLTLDDGSGASPSLYLKNGDDNYWRIFNDDSLNLIFRVGTTTKFDIDSSGNGTFAGTIGATNFSGSSSGTNTGDQDLSGYLTSLPSHNHDGRYYTETEINTKYTTTDGSGD